MKLRDTVSTYKHRYRGHTWYVLSNALGRQQFRVSEAVYRLFSELDGRRTLQQVWESLAKLGKVDPAVRHEALTTLTQLQAAGMLTLESLENASPLVEQQRQARRRGHLSRWLKPLSPRFPLFDPDSLLERSMPWVNWVFHPAALIVWLGVILLGFLQAAMHWEEMTLYGAQRITDTSNWALLVLLYPIIKALHELAHGYAAKRGGAEIHEMGITLLVFIPVPYVDASAASVFPDKYQRMLVGAAGIIVEAFLAALAVFFWLELPLGLARDVTFNMILIGGLSTVLFNGNPLLRFDGYYVLADAVEIPNLAMRAARYYGYLARRYLLGITSESIPSITPGERTWFLGYGAASTFYRLAVSVGIALFLVNALPVVGAIFAAWILVAQFGLPLFRQAHFLLRSPVLLGRRGRALSVVSSLLSIAVFVVALVPFPSSTVVDAIILPPERSIVRADIDGFLVKQPVSNKSRVSEGDLLFELINPELQTEVEIARARVREFEARRDAVDIADRTERYVLAERLTEARAELEDVEKRQDALAVHSRTAGVLQIPHSTDLNGHLFRRGDVLAYVADHAGAVIRAAVTQDQAIRIKDAVVAIRVRPFQRSSPVVDGELLNEVPEASDRLPSAALGSLGGGHIAVDARDTSGRKTLQNVFSFDISIPHVEAAKFMGSRALVRFEHPPVPIALRVYDTVRRLVMNRLGK